MASLQDDFWSAIFGDDVYCRPIGETHGLSSHSTHIASCFADLEKVNQDLESKLRDDFNNILNSMDRLSLSPAPRPPSPPLKPPTRTAIINSSFTIAAYSWLLENIANPYPSSTVKESLAQRHNCPLSAVNSWFVNARRRMGWTTVCRDYFNNCRADALDAAHRALVNEDPNRPLSPNIFHAFISMKVAAGDLYSSTFTKSALTSDLDAVVRDMTDPSSISAGGRKHRELKEVGEMSEVGLQDNAVAAQHYYSSPDYSCFSSPVPPLDESFTDDSEEDEEVSPPILAGRKRRLSFSEPSQLTSRSSAKRMKYLCSNASSPVETCLSSPSLSSKDSSDSRSQSQKPLSRPTPLSSSNIPTSQKRCPPDASTIEMPKHQGLITGLHLYAVPDPLPLSTPESDHIIDEWFKSNFDSLFALPPPVDVVGPDLSAQWEVELYKDYQIPQEPQRQPLRPLDSPGDQATTSMDLIALDNFLRSVEGGGFVVPPEIMDPPIVVPATESFPQDLSLSSDPIDWVGLLNEQTSEPSLDFIFAQSHTDLLHLPEIDLSILQLP